MSNDPEFSTERQIHKRLDAYRQLYWFDGDAPEQLWRWQVERRRQVRRAMRLELETVYAPPRAETIETDVRNDVRIEFIALNTEPDFWLPVYVLEPVGQDNGRTLIALHGEGRGAIDVLGVADDVHARRHIRQHRYDYAHRWARAGFTVVAPELRGYGRLMLQDDRERLDRGPAEQLWRNSVDRLAAIYLRVGRTYAGSCVTDLIRVIDYLEDREDVDADRIGIGGMGEGARVLSWLIAVEDRLGAAVAAGIKRADAEALFRPQIGPPAMIDGRALVDHASIFACHVPRPLCLQCGRRDKEMPPEHFQAIADRLARLYRLCGAEERLVIDVHSGGRVFRQEHVGEFFERHL